jgi:integrase
MDCNKIVFTTKRLQTLETPTSGRVYWYDSKTPGMSICISSTGVKTYYLYKWSNGRPVRVRIGKFNEISLDDARKTTAQLIGDMAGGVDIAAERRAKRQERSLSDVWNDWLEIHAKPRKRTWKDDQRQWKKYIEKDFGHRRVSSLKTSEIAKWHAKLGNDFGHIQANRAKALLATVLNYAVKVGYLVTNPCRSVPNFPEQSRERFLLPAEMKTFFDSVAALGEPWYDFFQLCLFTGARRGHVASMAWSEIDLNRTTWTIPASKTKNKRPLVIALAPPAVAILQGRIEITDGVWVFPAHSASGHVVDPRKAWEALRKKSGLQDLRMHDLRRSLGSWQAAAGASLIVIGKSLGHADLKSTQVYSKLQLDPIRESVANAARAMLDAATPKIIDAKGIKMIESKGCDDEQKE